jgi:hypothetical protein
MQTKFILYSTEGCHLCDIAKGVLISVGLDPTHDIETIDIITDATLLDAYKESIPVVMNIRTKEQLFWPFDAQDVKGML